MRHGAKEFHETQKSHPHLRSRFASIIFTCLIISLLVAGALVLLLRDLGIFAVALAANPLVFILLLYLVSAGVASAVTYFVSQQILRPIESLSDVSLEVAKGNFNVSCDEETNIEELDTVIENFNGMARELAATETLREDFIANVSHEFKTPLAAMEGYATLLSDPGLPEEERREYAERILLSVRRLSGLTGNILLISKLENDAYKMNTGEFRLDEQIREAILELETEWSKKEIDFDITLEEITVTSAEGLLHELWINLIGNAIKYSHPRGRVTVRLDKNGDMVKAVVADNGIGMSDEVKRHIFEKFYQGDTSRRSEGNGLGLALSWRIVKALSGEIGVESEEGRGSVFTVVLPFHIN